MAFSQAAQAQCTQLVTHLSGTQQIGCTTVTVTSAGETNAVDFCGIGPYFIGDNPSGSFTFTFSPPVSGVTIGLSVVNNLPDLPAVEEIEFEVNGTFYPITVPGTTHSCATNTCIILPSGRVGAPPTINGPFFAGWEDQPIIETINSLKITNVVTSGFPVGSLFSLRICEQCCATDAGVLSGSPLQVCLPLSASFSPSTQTNLEPDDLLQYILHTDANNPEGSILATSNAPDFAFNPATMQVGVTYYVAAMAGNGVNGNVDLNDPCLDFSNALTVVWQPTPTVTFTVANPEVCQGGCIEFTVNFTGTAPFGLGYENPFTGALQNQVFLEETGEILLCSPIGASLGNYSLQAVSLSDANCVCD
jgi:hypothetical protein